MAPTEATILSNFLLPPAPLPAVISLKTFTALFTKVQQTQSSDHIRALYRDLQLARRQLTDAISVKIEKEAKNGIAQRRMVIRSRRLDGRDGIDDEVEVESAVSCAFFPST